jgi:hypothetical protein
MLTIAFQEVSNGKSTMTTCVSGLL